MDSWRGVRATSRDDGRGECGQDFVGTGAPAAKEKTTEKRSHHREKRSMIVQNTEFTHTRAHCIPCTDVLLATIWGTPPPSRPPLPSPLSPSRASRSITQAAPLRLHVHGKHRSGRAHRGKQKEGNSNTLSHTRCRQGFVLSVVRVRHALQCRGLTYSAPSRSFSQPYWPP